MLLSKVTNFLRDNFSRRLDTHNLIEVSREAVLHNYDFFQKLHPGSQIWPVLKSNAYGHGIRQVASILKTRQFEYIVVDNYYEALKVWEVSNQKVLLIGFPPIQNLQHFDYSRTSLIIYNLEMLHELGRLNKPVKIHLKINSGLNRQGVKLQEVEGFLEVIKSYPKLELEGVCSHLASADDEKENDYTARQEQVFLQAVKKVQAQGFRPKYLHLSNTAGVVRIKNSVCNSIRLGIGLYGLNPIEPEDSQWSKLEGLRPALRFTSQVINLVDLESGDRVSYAGTFVAPKKMTIGLLPVGYYEALPRSISNRVFVKFEDKFLPLVGNVCMNLSMFDCWGLDIKVGDRIEIISPCPKDKNSAYGFLSLVDANPYEFLTGLAEPIRRRVVEGF